MKVRDDVGSIEDLRTTPDAGGATVSANSTPKDNVVVGIDLSTSAFNNRFTIRYDNAYSLYANDISGGPFTKAEFDSLLEENGTKGISLNPEKLESFFILNASMIPIDPRGLTNTAQQLRASLQLGTHTIGFRWRSVGGSYYTLGQTSLQRDRAGLRLQDSFRMFGNALGVTVGWEQSRDNLDGSKADDTGTSALTLDLAYQADPLAPGFAVGYRTFGRQNDLPTLGEGGVEENTATYSAGAFLPVRVLSGMRSRININYTNVGREDALNPQTGTDNIYYLVGFASRFEDRPTDFSVTYGLNQSKLTGFTDANTTFNRLLLKGRHGLSESLFATGDVTLTTATSPEPPGGSLVQGLKYSRTELLLGGEYYWTPTSFASLRAGFATYKDDRRSNLDTSEFALKLRLVRAF